MSLLLLLAAGGDRPTEVTIPPDLLAAAAGFLDEAVRTSLMDIARQVAERVVAEGRSPEDVARQLANLRHDPAIGPQVEPLAELVSWDDMDTAAAPLLNAGRRVLAGQPVRVAEPVERSAVVDAIIVCLLVMVVGTSGGMWLAGDDRFASIFGVFSVLLAYYEQVRPTP